MMVDYPVDWNAVERIRTSFGTTGYLMRVWEDDTHLYGFILERDGEGELDFRTVPQEDATSRMMWLLAKALIIRRTPMRQNPTTGQWFSTREK